MTRRILSWALVVLGLLQSAGWCLRQDWLRGLGQLSVASPLPIVFTEVDGVETFALDIYLQYRDSEGGLRMTRIDSALYSQFDAPYNYRNVIGAAVSYGPVMPEEIRDPVLHYAFAEPGDLVKSLGLEPPLADGTLVLKSRTADSNASWTIPIE